MLDQLSKYLIFSICTFVDGCSFIHKSVTFCQLSQTFFLIFHILPWSEFMSYHWKCVAILFANPFHQIFILLPAFYFWGKFLSHSYLLPNFVIPWKCVAKQATGDLSSFYLPIRSTTSPGNLPWSWLWSLWYRFWLWIIIWGCFYCLFLCPSFSFFHFLTIVCCGAGETQYEVVSGRGIGLCLWVICFSLSYSHNFHSHFQKSRMF